MIWTLCIVAVITLVGAAGWFVLRRRRSGGENLRLEFVAVDEAPPDAADQIVIVPPPDTPLAGAATFWKHLAGIAAPQGRTPPPHVSFEYSWSTDGVSISLWVPRALPAQSITQAVQAAWPGAHTTVHRAAPPIPERATVTGGALRLGAPEVLPLVSEHPADPLRAIFAAAESRQPGDHSVVQILVRPASARRLKRSLRQLSHLRAAADPRGSSRQLGTTEQNARTKAALAKASHPRFEVNIRYATGRAADQAISALHEQRLKERATAIASAFALFDSPHNQLRPKADHDLGAVLATRRFHRGDLLSVPELAALAHLPLDSAVPGLARAGARAIPPPPAVPPAEAGPHVKLLGDTDAGVPRSVAMPVSGARHHVHVTGATGTGKTTLITQWVLADVAAGRGAVVLDCKGDQVNDLLDRLPLDVAERTVLIDPAQPGPSPGINVIAGPDPHLAVDHLVGIFRQMYSDSWGPRTDDILRSACLTLATTRRTTASDATLADVPRLLTDLAYRTTVIAELQNPVLEQFWAWYDLLRPPGRAAAIAPVQNKLRALLLRPFIRAAIAQPHTSIDLGKILDGGLLLVRMPKGELGGDTVQLLGSFLLSALWEYTTHRVRLGEQLRRDATVYLDEAFNYLGLIRSLEDLLAEARAFHLCLVLAHQDLAQIPRDLRESLSTNARNKVIFAVSPEDARVHQHHVQPNLSAHDLAHLDAFQAAAQLIINNAITPAFTLRTRPLPPPVPGRAQTIRERLTPRSRNAGADRPPGASAQPVSEDRAGDVVPLLGDPRIRSFDASEGVRPTFGKEPDQP